MNNSHIKFVGELLYNISKNHKFDGHISIGNGLYLKDILPIQSELNKEEYSTGFSGVNLIIKSDGHVFFRATRNRSEGHPTTISRAYSVNKNGSEKAFYLAVVARAEYCNFSGTINFERLSPPDLDSIIGFAKESKGREWLLSTDFERKLRESCE